MKEYNKGEKKGMDQKKKKKNIYTNIYLYTCVLYSEIICECTSNLVLAYVARTNKERKYGKISSMQSGLYIARNGAELRGMNW